MTPDQLDPSKGSLINNLLARCSHLFPSLRQAWYAIPLRLIVGYGFMEHGYAKLARGPDNFAGILHALGMPASVLLAWTTVIVELLGGLAVFVGAFVPLASVPMAFVLLVAILTVHLPNGFSSIKLQSVTAGGANFGQPGYETDLLYLAALAALVLGGSGPLALDRFSMRRSGEIGRIVRSDCKERASCPSPRDSLSRFWLCRWSRARLAHCEGRPVDRTGHRRPGRRGS
jgi:putative oxidoreductase